MSRKPGRGGMVFSKKFHRQVRTTEKRRKAAKNGKNGRVIHSPQDLSFISSSLILKDVSCSDDDSLSPVEISGNVEKRPACDRQVFASMDATGMFIADLKKRGIAGTAVRCETCKLIHVQESRP